LQFHRNEDYTAYNLYNELIEKKSIIDEGACPIFKRNEIKTEEVRTITFSQDEQLGIYILIFKNNLFNTLII